LLQQGNSSIAGDILPGQDELDSVEQIMGEGDPSAESEDKLQVLMRIIADLRRQHEINKKNLNGINVGLNNVLPDLMGELNVDQIDKIMPRVKDLTYMWKQSMKFLDAVGGLMESLHKPIFEVTGKGMTATIDQSAPPGMRIRDGKGANKLSLKQCWKWVKRLLEDNLWLKRDHESVLGYLRIDNERDLMTRLAQITTENEAMSKLAGRLRQYFRIPQNAPLSEIEKIIEIEGSRGGVQSTGKGYDTEFLSGYASASSRPIDKALKQSKCLMK
jgi:hypothetical protein